MSKLSPTKSIIAGILSWLVPGAGHFFSGERTRGIIIFIGVTLAFWVGIMIGGARSTVNWQTNFWWALAQMFAGGYMMVTLMLGKAAAAMPSYGKTLDLATIYTGIAGLLNLLAILDAMVRALGIPRDEETSGEAAS